MISDRGVTSGSLEVSAWAFVILALNVDDLSIVLVQSSLRSRCSRYDLCFLRHRVCYLV